MPHYRGQVRGWALKRRLVELGFQAIRARGFESNRLYDFKDDRLRKASWVLRLRFAGGGCILTLKCGPVASRSYKIRREIETEIANGERLSRILRTLGMPETLRYQRYHTVYGCRGSSGSRQLAYNETPFGNYIELEGPKRWIDQTARQLGYQRKDYITLGYPTLYSLCAGRVNSRPVNCIPAFEVLANPDVLRLPLRYNIGSAEPLVYGNPPLRLKRSRLPGRES
jgi:adenylate cyclase, class 2